MPNELAFSVTQSVEATGQLTSLGMVQTREYQQIRVFADCRGGSPSSAEIILSFVEGEGAPGHLDRYLLAPGADVQQVYDVRTEVRGDEERLEAPLRLEPLLRGFSGQKTT